MTPWPTGVPKPDAVEQYELMRHLVYGSNVRHYADDMLAECAEIIERVMQCHIYRFPVMAQDAETGEVGIHWIDGFNVAEVMQTLRSDDEFTAYQSVTDTYLMAEQQATIERLDGMLRLAIHTDWSEYDCNGVPEVPDETRLADLARRYEEQEAADA